MLSLTDVDNRMIFVRAREKKIEETSIDRQLSLRQSNVLEIRNAAQRSHLHGDGELAVRHTLHARTDIYCCHRFSFAPSNQFSLLLLWLQLHVLVIYCTWINLVWFCSWIFINLHLLVFGKGRNKITIAIESVIWSFLCDLFVFDTRNSRSARNWHTPCMGRPT